MATPAPPDPDKITKKKEILSNNLFALINMVFVSVVLSQVFTDNFSAALVGLGVVGLIAFYLLISYILLDNFQRKK